MAGVARVGADTAGGAQLGGGQGYVRLDGRLVVVRGDAVAGHPPCPLVPSHCAATMVGAVDWIRIDGTPICVAGDAASCGHATTGSQWVAVTP